MYQQAGMIAGKNHGQTQQLAGADSDCSCSNSDIKPASVSYGWHAFAAALSF